MVGGNSQSCEICIKCHVKSSNFVCTRNTWCWVVLLLSASFCITFTEVVNAVLWGICLPKMKWTMNCTSVCRLRGVKLINASLIFVVHFPAGVRQKAEGRMQVGVHHTAEYGPVLYGTRDSIFSLFVWVYNNRLRALLRQFTVARLQTSRQARP